MTREASKKTRVRMTLDLSTSVRNQLEALRNKIEADTFTETIRRAIIIYDLLCDEKNKGNTIIFRTPDGEEERLIIP